MSRFLQRLTGCIATPQMKTLALSAGGSGLFGAVAGYAINGAIVLPLLVGALCGLLCAAACSGFHSVLRRVKTPARLCCLLTIIAFGFAGPVVVGFVTTFASRHHSGSNGVLALAGLMGLGPLMMAIYFCLVGSYHARGH